MILKKLKQKQQVAVFGKTIDEIKNEEKQAEVDNTAVEEKTVETKIEEENKNEAEESTTNLEPKDEVQEEKPNKELVFAYPVEGEILREYAKDNLVYSETLKEWVTHTGIDIKADKTTVVKASEEGTITAIKNDPRYGITVIIEHTNGFETRYANLLTAEFVTIGEEVTKGQTIGTVGNTAAFEILDDYHLHFELLKNGEYQDPSVYLK